MSNKFFQFTSILLTFVITYVSLKESQAQAAKIPLNNPGFEQPEQTTEPFPGAGFFDFETPTGWDLYDPNSLIPEDASIATPFTGGWKPSEAFFADIPEGEQIGTIFLVPPGAGEVGFAQTSTAVIEPNKTYTLSASILNPPGLPGAEAFAGFPGYRLELLAGDTVIASDNNTIFVEEGEFATATVSYSSLVDDTYLGDILGIRLINTNLDNSSGLDGGNGIEVNFDDVKLSGVAVPEPISILGSIIIGAVLLPLKKHRVQK